MVAQVADFWIDYQKGMNPIRPWDKLIIGNYVFPGILAQFSPDVSLSVDVAKYMTKFSATTGPEYKIRLTDKGYEPAKIRAVLATWEADQWDDLKDGIAAISPKTTSRTRVAYDIVHPACSVLGIKQIIVTRMSVPLPINGTLFTEFDLLEWFPGTPFKVSRPSGEALPVFTADKPSGDFPQQ